MDDLIEWLRSLARRPSGGRIVPRDHGDSIPAILSPGMTAKEIVEYYGEDLALRINGRRKLR